MKIKIIGDSIAAGVGSSNLKDTDEIIFEDENSTFYKRIAPNSWWGLLENKFKNVEINNLGCGGAYSYQLLNNLDKLIDKDDDIIIILVGLNDRKRKDGLNELYENLNKIIDELKNQRKKIVLLTPPPSTAENENFPNRIYHTNEIVETIRKVAEEKKVMLIDIYNHINEYLVNQKIKIEDIIYGEGCKNDGLHPGDKIQSLMYERIINDLKGVDLNE